jgi:trans-2,3-dihydro-3-hydroxyanthranilate isomerase
MVKSHDGEPMPERKYQIYDVFTGEALAGNPLAILHDCEGLDTAAMQAIAREFNLSETVFVAPALKKPHAAAIRIFTPNFEMPFAGHPTIGSAHAALESGFVPRKRKLVQECGAGLIELALVAEHLGAQPLGEVGDGGHGRDAQAAVPRGDDLQHGVVPRQISI